VIAPPLGDASLPLTCLFIRQRSSRGERHGRLYGDKDDGSRVQRPAPASEMRDIFALDVGRSAG